MSFSPLLVLPIVFPGGEGEEWGKGVVGWAHVMGDAEFFMTWVYFLSAFCLFFIFILIYFIYHFYYSLMLLLRILDFIPDAIYEIF